MKNIFTWVASTVGQFKSILLRVFFISLCLNLLNLAMPLAMMAITDRVIVHKGFNTLQILVLGLFILEMFEIILSFIRTYLMTHTSLCITLDISARIYEKLLAIKSQYFDNRTVGEIMNRVQEVHHIKDFLVGAPISILIDIIFAIIFLFVLFFIEPLLSIITLLTVPLHIVSTIIVTRIRESYLNEQFRIAMLNQSSMIETISSIQTVKLMSIEQSLKNLWITQTTDGAEVSFKIAKIEAISGFITSFFNKLSTILVLYFGASKVMLGQITLGTLLAFNSFSAYVVGPLISLAGLWKSVQQLSLAGERLQEIFEAPVENEHEAIPIQVNIENLDIRFENVYFRYPSMQSNALSNINLTIKKGEIIGITGPSGSGKSTLIKLLQGLYEPTEGKILIGGQDITSLSSKALRHMIGSVPQESFLFSRTIAQNIAIGKSDATLADVRLAAQMAGISDFIESLPQAYDNMVEERGINFSGGQRQRIAIARSLILNPQILIFDEATSALDYESEKIIHDNMRFIAADRTVIIISHRLEAFKIADKIAVLSNGVIQKVYDDIGEFFQK